MRNEEVTTLPANIVTQDAAKAAELLKRQQEALRRMGDMSLIARPHNDELRRQGRR